MSVRAIQDRLNSYGCASAIEEEQDLVYRGMDGAAVKAAAAVMALWTRVLIRKAQLPDERWVVRGVVSP